MHQMTAFESLGLETQRQHHSAAQQLNAVIMNLTQVMVQLLNSLLGAQSQSAGTSAQDPYAETATGPKQGTLPNPPAETIVEGVAGPSSSSSTKSASAADSTNEAQSTSTDKSEEAQSTDKPEKRLSKKLKKALKEGKEILKTFSGKLRKWFRSTIALLKN